MNSYALSAVRRVIHAYLHQSREIFRVLKSAFDFLSPSYALLLLYFYAVKFNNMIKFHDMLFYTI